MFIGTSVVLLRDRICNWIVADRAAIRTFCSRSEQRQSRPTHKARESLATCVPRPVWTLACLGGPVAGLCLYPAELTVVGDVEIRADKKVEIRAEVDGLISSVLVTEGDIVTVNKLIACLASRESSAELAQIKAQVKRQQAELVLLKSGAKPEQINLAKAAV